VKLYYFSPIFRYERPQAGRFANTISSDVKPSGKRMHFLMPKLSTWPGNFWKSLGLKIRCFLSTVSAVRNAGQISGGFKGAILPTISANFARIAGPVWTVTSCGYSIVNSPVVSKSSIRRRKVSIISACPVRTISQLKNYLGILEIPFEVNQRLCGA